MFTTSIPAWRCTACKNALKADSYYCKKCGALVSSDLAPDAREIDRSFSTRLLRMWRMRAVAKISWTLIIVLALFSGSYFYKNTQLARKDNHSSAIFVMKVDHPDNPFNCSGNICQVTVEISNKSGKSATLRGVPYFLLQSGKVFGPVPRAIGEGRLYFFDRYCTQKFNLTLAPKASEQFVGICTQDLPSAEPLALLKILDEKGQILLSTTLKVSTPAKY